MDAGLIEKNTPVRLSNVYTELPHLGCGIFTGGGLQETRTPHDSPNKRALHISGGFRCTASKPVTECTCGVRTRWVDGDSGSSVGPHHHLDGTPRCVDRHSDSLRAVQVAKLLNNCKLELTHGSIQLEGNKSEMNSPSIVHNLIPW